MLPLKRLWILVFFNFQFVSYVSCEDGISLAFAIDDTRSMWNDIAQVKKQAKVIMDMVLTTKTSKVKDFVLVTINDPDVTLRTKTKSPSDFLGFLNRIKVHNYGNTDCAERALAGIEKALEFSRPESYIYVFTDATTKELEKLNSIKKLCQKKQSQVVLVLTGDCRQPFHRNFTIYYDVAKACSGQVFRVTKDQVHSVLKTIEILLKGKNSIFKWKKIPRTPTYVPVEFTLDGKAEYAIVSTSGKNVKLKITTVDKYWGSEPESERAMWNNNGKVVNLINPKSGTYYAWVKGDSTISVVVYGRTDFTFGYGFSVLEPKSMTDTAKQPIAGLKQHLSINVTDPDQSVDIISAQILDINKNDRVLTELPLRSIGGNMYITEAFLSSNDTFKIAIKGVIKKTRETIIRNSFNIDPQIVDLIPESIPDVKIDEGLKLDVNYGSGVSLTCKVTAHPAPKIEWYSSSGAFFPSNCSVLEDPLFVSYLKLDNIKKSDNYVCKASNKKGSGKDIKIQVNVRPVFTPKNSVTEEPVYNARYGEDVKFPCNIKSYLPIKIKWYRTGKQLSDGSVLHSISPNGELTLKSMSIGMQGKYTCEATLDSDPAVKQTHDVEVKIPGLARPEIQSTNSNVSLMKGGKMELNCKIVHGYPKPEVKWFKKNDNSYIPVVPVVSSEVLRVNKALFTNAGQYKCKATNEIGTDTASFDVTVNSLPQISITGTMKEVPYDSNAELTCKVESYPLASIIWKDEQGTVLPSKTTKISEYEFTSQLELFNIRKNGVIICWASNNVGSNSDYVDIKVLSPFTIKTHMKDKIGINYGSKITLQCDIKSTKPMTVRWYKQVIGIKSSRSIISSSDRYTISGDGTELTINFMEIDMAGKYTCEASLLSVPTEKVTFSTTAEVVGLIRPEITYSTTVLNEKNFTAICRINGVPKPIISWQFKPKGSEEFSPIPGSGEELNISELRLNHTGVYKCIANNVLGRTQRDLNVVVEERPIIINENPNFYGTEGDLVMKIPCDVTGFPEPTIIWKKGGKDLNMDTKFVVKGSTLYINKPVESDSEEYTCEAKNKLGNETKKFVVEVVDSFESDENFMGDTYDTHAEQGKQKTITCNLKNAGEGAVRWYLDGILTNQTGSTYTVESASISDEANYTCRVNIDEESKSETYVLYVGYPPIFEDNSPSPVTIEWQDSRQMLDCTADSQPHAKYVWISNGKVVKSGNNLKQITITNWGNYTCQVSNVHGNVSKTFDVISSGCYITMNLATENQPLVSDMNTPTWPVSVGNNDILLDEKEEIKFSCPSNTKSTNTFKILPSKQEVTAKCIAQDKFSVDGNIYQYSDLQCNREVEPSVINTREQCSVPSSEMIRVGFGVNGTMETYKVCFDRSLNVPLFASASPFISRIGDGVDLTKFKWSSVPELGYRKTGNWKPEGSCKCCYTQGQLVNVNELPFGPAQAATFKDNLNSVPIWNPSCDDSSRTSWQAFEEEIRAMSLYNTWTGASEYSTTSNGLVPRFIWKVLNYEEGSTVMVYVNDKSPVDSDVRCTITCESLMEADKFLYCCTLEDFSEKFGVPLDTFKSVD